MIAKRKVSAIATIWNLDAKKAEYSEGEQNRQDEQVPVYLDRRSALGTEGKGIINQQFIGRIDSPMSAQAEQVGNSSPTHQG